MKDIFNSHSVATLKGEIRKANIKGYSKMKKAELVDLMVKNKSKFSHIKMAEKKGNVRGKPAPKAKTPSPPKDYSNKDFYDYVDARDNNRAGKATKEEKKYLAFVKTAEGQKHLKRIENDINEIPNTPPKKSPKAKRDKKPKKPYQPDNLQKAIGINRKGAKKMDFFDLMKKLPKDIKRNIGGMVKADKAASPPKPKRITDQEFRDFSFALSEFETKLRMMRGSRYAKGRAEAQQRFREKYKKFFDLGQSELNRKVREALE